MERRKSARVSYRTAMFLTDSNKNVLIEFLSDNLSESGVFVKSDNVVFKSKKNLQLRFNIPSVDEPIKTKVKVIYTISNPTGDKNIISGVGLGFIDLADKYKNAINSFIKSR